MLRNKVDPNELDQHGMAPLHYMAIEGSEDIFKLLLNKGADISLPDNKGKVALHHACENNCLPLIKFILDFSPNVNVKDNYGRTPLDLAKEKDHTAVVAILEKSGKAGNAEPDNYEDCEPLRNSKMIEEFMKTIQSLQKEVRGLKERLHVQEKTSKR